MTRIRGASFEIQPIRVLLTVPHLLRTASPYREMMALAQHLPHDEFSLIVCSLRSDGLEDIGPDLRRCGADVFVARFRPRGWKTGHLASVLEDQDVIDAHGPYDVQHSMDFSSSPVEAILARLRGRRYVFSQRNLNVGGHSSLLRIKGALAHRIIAISSATRDMLESKRIPKTKVTVVHLGIEHSVHTEHESPPPEAREPFLLSVGHIVPLKRHQDAIAALARVAPTFPDFRLLIVGRVVDSQCADSLHNLIRSHGLEERVHMVGARSDVLTLMKRARCLIHCAESEAGGWVILEAMMARLPVVASAVGGIKEVVAHDRNGLLVSVGDVEGFAAGIRRVLGDPELARSLSSQGAADVLEKYSATRMVQGLADVYRDVCRPSRAPQDLGVPA